MSDDHGKSGASGLLGDLESIRTLLDEDRAADADAPAEDRDDDVPLLEDVVRGGVSVNETFLSGEGDFAETADADPGLNEEIFKALLSDEWRQSAREMLDQARAAIERHQNDWTPEHTDELNAALKVRIDETVQRWLQEVVQSRMDELRKALLAAVGAELDAMVREQQHRTSSSPSSASEESDGA